MTSNRCDKGKNILLVTLVLLCLLCAVQFEGKQYQFLRTLYKEMYFVSEGVKLGSINCTGDSFASFVSHTSFSNSFMMNSMTYQERLKRYKQRYNYHLPTTYFNHTLREEICGPAPNYTKYFQGGPGQRSGDGEDKVIYELFFKNASSIERGSVVEMGAYNGIQQSNSRFFDVCLGWNNLLIEGMPKTYEQLLLNRPQAHRMNFAPSCTEEEEMANKTVKFDNYPQTNAGVSGAANVTTAYTAKKWTVDVPCGPLTPVLLDMFPNGHVTFFSLDVEGSEPYIVQNIDFKRIFIEIMIIEHANHFCRRNDHCQSRDNFRRMMDNEGYIRFTKLVAKSDLYIHPKSKYLNILLKNPSYRTMYDCFMDNKNDKNIIPHAATRGAATC
ncbi:hypothetical protein CTEN210_05447 [Chaetoceros tenuissimus]|uniref:Methyltransferase FkbM domain-containing protein n=1 Tax=Chaetoceros tenuissimus TaxID=426638 RepID=A0AAD3CN20_9STRA|nr:hypothetical protein CTEN210_05447 [Chaetoceros tenuissimus]